MTNSQSLKAVSKQKDHLRIKGYKALLSSKSSVHIMWGYLIYIQTMPDGKSSESWKQI